MVRKWYWSLLLAVPLLVSLPGCGGKAEDEKSGEGGGSKEVALPSAETPINTQYISKDFVAAVVVHPARVLNSKFGQDVQAALEELQPGMAKNALDKATEESGIDPRNVEQVVVLIDEAAGMEVLDDMPLPGRRRKRKEAKTEDFEFGKKEPFPGEKKADCIETEFQPGFPEGKKDGPALKKRPPRPEPAVVFRLSKAADEAKVLKGFGDKEYDFSGEKIKVKKVTPPQKIESDGMTYYKARKGTLAILEGGKTIIIAQEHLLKKMIPAKDVDSPLTKRLSTLGAEHDLIIATAGPAIEKQLSQFPEEAAGPAKEYAAYIKKAKSLAITVSVSSDPMLSIVLELPEESSASGLAKLVNDKAIPELKKSYEEMKTQAKDAAPPEAVSAIDEIVNGILVGSKGNDFIMSLKRPSALENPKDLIKNLAPFLGGAF